MIREVGRYGAKGAAFVGLNVAVQVALVEAGGMSPELAAALSTACMPLLGYVAMNRFVFPDAESVTGWASLRRFGAYYATNLSSKAVNYGLFLALLWAGVWYPVAYVAGAAVVFVGTFTVNRWLWHGSVTA